MIAVVGAANVDICGTPNAFYLPGDSNPGRVRVSMGGVGRNIAENLRRLGHEVRLIAPLGQDANAEAVQNSCRELGIDISHSVTVPEGRTSTYLCLNNQRGDLVGAVSDMDICKMLTPEALEARMDAINEAELVVAEANLPAESLRFLARHARPPLYADPVSVTKAGRLSGALFGLAAVKPNVPEASHLSGVPIASDGDLPRAAARLHEAGVGLVFLSLGNRGVYYDGEGAHGFLPCFAGKVTDTTGCGDAFLAGAAHARLHGKGVRDATLTGLAAAAICAACEGAVSPHLNPEAIQNLLEGGAL